MEVDKGPGEGILGFRLGKAKAPRLGDKGPLRSRG